MSCFAVMLIIVPTPFYSQAEEKIRIEMISAYEDKIKTEFDTLQQKYDKDIITYQNDLDQYHTNLDSPILSIYRNCTDSSTGSPEKIR